MGRSLEGYILGIIPYISFEKCIEECLSRRRCLSLNYKQQFPICELNYETKSENSGKTFTVSKGTAYTEMTKWKKVCHF
ncbi:hypothetical protein FSP39_020908 [Pinctada imbricata]|uniref:Apple domain-containing protein n=1 Tax=Pinctada imbricata TaxID=66713 RepID=A0AA88XQJ0_PINIB|nr:hypothetical protein FSP39_020908 [Pinctada imbricata]